MAVPPVTPVVNIQPDENFSSLDRWINILTYDITIFNIWVKDDRLDFLSSKDRHFLMRYIERLEITPEHLELLTLAGYNLNYIDSSGRTKLTHIHDFDLYKRLKALGGVYIHPQKSELDHFFGTDCNLVNEADVKYELICICLADLTIEKFKLLRSNTFKTLFVLAKKHALIAQSLLPLFLEWQKLDYLGAARKFLDSFFHEGINPSCQPVMKYLIQGNHATGEFIEAIYSSSKVFLSIFFSKYIDKKDPVEEKELSELIRNKRLYSLLFLSLLQHEDIRTALLLLCLMKSNTLKEIGVLLTHVDSTRSIKRSHSILALRHIQIVENGEHDSVWNHLEYIDWKKFIFLIENLELNPNSCDDNQRNIPFTKISSRCRKTLQHFKVNTSQIDSNGHNALEYFVLNKVCRTHQDQIISLKNLCILGLKITKSIPYYNFCAAETSDSFSQALLAMVINSKNFKSVYTYVSNHAEYAFITVSLRKLKAFDLKLQFLTLDKNLFNLSWKRNYTDENAARIETLSLTALQHELICTYFSQDEISTILDFHQDSYGAGIFCAFLHKLETPSPEILYEILVRLIINYNDVVVLLRNFLIQPFLLRKFHFHCKAVELHVGGNGHLRTTYVPIVKFLTDTLVTFSTRNRLIGSFSELKVEERFTIPDKMDKSHRYYFYQGKSSLQEFKIECAKWKSILIESGSSDKVNFKIYKEKHPLIPNSIKPPLFAIEVLSYDHEKSFQGNWLKDYADLTYQKCTPQVIPAEGPSRSRKDQFVMGEFLMLLNSHNGLSKYCTCIPAYHDILEAEIEFGELSRPAHEYEKPFAEIMAGSDFFNDMEGLARGLRIAIFIQLKHWKDQGVTIDWTNTDLRKQMAKMLLNGFIQIATGYSKEEEGVFRPCFSGLNWNRMAAQILFWADTTHNGYVSWLHKKRLPEEIFDKDMKIFLDFFSLRNIINEKRNCFEINGHECIEIKGWVDFHLIIHTALLTIVAFNQPLQEGLIKPSKKYQFYTTVPF